jgi:hypothetical protein
MREREGRNPEVFERTVTVTRVIAVDRLFRVSLGTLLGSVLVRVVVVVVVPFVLVLVAVAVLVAVLVLVRTSRAVPVCLETEPHRARRTVLMLEPVVDTVRQRKQQHRRHEDEQAEKAGARRAERQRGTHSVHSGRSVLVA